MVVDHYLRDHHEDLFTDKEKLEHYHNRLFNGFDFDELYDLDADPDEMINIIDSENYKKEKKEIIKLYWQELKKNGDHSILNLDNNPIMKIIEFGPNE